MASPDDRIISPQFCTPLFSVSAKEVEKKVALHRLGYFNLFLLRFFSFPLPSSCFLPLSLGFLLCSFPKRSLALQSAMTRVMTGAASTRGGPCPFRGLYRPAAASASLCPLFFFFPPLLCFLSLLLYFYIIFVRKVHSARVLIDLPMLASEKILTHTKPMSIRCQSNVRPFSHPQSCLSA